MENKQKQTLNENLQILPIIVLCAMVIGILIIGLFII